MSTPEAHHQHIGIIRRYHNALHKIKTGWQVLQRKNAPELEPAAVKMGVTQAQADHSALIRVLVSKGLITESEYLEQCAARLEEEAKELENKMPDGVRLI